MIKKKKICKNCCKEILQGHRCHKEGYKVSNRKLHVPQKANKNIYERVEVNLGKDNCYLFIPSGAQLNGFIINDEHYLKNLKEVNRKMNNKIKSFSAGCEYPTD